MTASRRVRSLAAAILRPWAVVAAILAGLAAALPELGRDDAWCSVSVWQRSWPHPRMVALNVRLRDEPDPLVVGGPTDTWMDSGGFAGGAVTWVSRGVVSAGPPWLTGPRRGRAGALPVLRPAGAEADSVLIHTSLWLWLGLPAFASVVAAWMWLRRRLDDEDGDPSLGRAALTWRLARPWVWTFAPIGLALVLAGNNGWTGTPDEFGRLMSAGLQFTAVPPDGPQVRSLSAWRYQRQILTAEEADARTHDGGEVWGVWPLTVSTTRYDLADQSVSDWEADFAMQGRTVPAAYRGGTFTDTQEEWAVSVWWLVAVAATGNLVTLGRLLRQRRGDPSI